MNRNQLAAILAGFCALAIAQSPGASAPPEQGEFVLAVSKFDIELDPHHAYTAAEAQIFTALYEGLFVSDPKTLEPTPALCESYVRSKDKKTYTFKIRPNARYSNGQPIKAQDLRASWLRMISPSEDAEYSSLFDVIKGVKAYRLGQSADADKVGIKAGSDSILIVDLESPTAYFTKLLCHHSFSLLHPSMLSQDAWKGAKDMPVSGPYSIKSLSADEIVMVKNPYYWDAANVAVPSIRVIFSDDDADMVRRFNSGEIHWLTSTMNLTSLLDSGAVQITKPLFATSYLYVRADRKPWNDPRLSQALALLVPWKQLHAKLDTYIPADSLIPAIQGYPKVSAPAQDADKAKGLMEKAGFKDGVGLPELVLRLTEGESNKTLADVLTQAWQAAGIKVRSEFLPGQGYYDALKAGGYTVASMSWIGDFSDPMTFLQMWTADSNLNDSGFSDKDYEKILSRSMSEEGAARMKTLSEAEQLLLDSGVCMPLSHSISVNIISTDAVGGWQSNPLDIHPFKFLNFISSPPVQGVVMAPR